VQIALLGPLEVRPDSGPPVEVGGARLRTLLILLALDAGRVATTQRLIDGVWADAPPVGAANALQALVSRLRRTVPELPVESHPAGYRLAIPPDRVDVARFERLVGAGRAALPHDPATAAEVLSEALGLWRGPALADVVEADFARAPAARLAELRLGALEDRIEAELRSGAGAAGLLAELEELAAEHPLRERLIAVLLRALYAAGRPADALAAYERARAALADQLGVDPSPALAALHVAILRGDPGLAPPAVPGSDGTAAFPPRTNLRAALTSFVGRDEDVFRVGKLLTESRLTTLTGPGGAGKTRLAVESARTLLDQMPDGVWVVELAPVTDPGGGELPQAALTALGLRETALLGTSRARALAGEPTDSGDPLDRLLAALADKRMLLVLDNCEHLIDAAAGLADRLLGACPDLRVLATSREPLGITGESLWPVEPLAMPPAGVPATQVTRYPSVRLLLDRATAVRPGFAIDDQTVAPVVRICRALDGMPLAIELAAARLRAMTPEQVANRLDDRFRLLTGGSRTALPRHQTLRAVVDWSWDLLDEPERTLLWRLAVFAGGATVEAAEQVCAGGPVAPVDVLDLLTALVDKSLLIAGGEARPRYRMLETIRAYGLERLAEAGEQDRVRRAHMDHFLALAERAEPHLRRADQLEWLARLTDERDNLHAALRSAIAAADAMTAIRFAGALGFYWWLSGRRAEGVDFAAEVLAMPGAVPAPLRASAYVVSALNGIEAHRDFEQIKAWFGSALELMASASAEELADTPVTLHPLLRMLKPFSTMMETNGDERSLPALEELQDDRDPWIRAVGLMMRAHVLVNLGRQHDQAEADFRRALDGFRALGERWGMAFALSALAELFGWRGEHRQAAALLEEALDYIGELGTKEDLPPIQVRYAQELWLRGERDRAGAVLAEAQRVAEQVGLPEVLTHVEIARADVARREAEEALHDGDEQRARDLFAVAARRLTAAAAMTRCNTSPQFEALMASGLGYLDAATGDFAGARTAHTTALERALNSRDVPVIAMVAVGIADLAVRSGDATGAAMLLGAAEQIRGVPFRDFPDGRRVERMARAALGDSAFADSHQRGLAATVRSIPELAGPVLGLDTGSWPPPSSPESASPRTPDASHAGGQKPAATPSA
jgi:predicted ATPase/DNA-binding SARP family transcriptional activator